MPNIIYNFSIGQTVYVIDDAIPTMSEGIITKIALIECKNIYLELMDIVFYTVKLINNDIVTIQYHGNLLFDDYQNALDKLSEIIDSNKCG